MAYAGWPDKEPIDTYHSKAKITSCVNIFSSHLGLNMSEIGVAFLMAAILIYSQTK